MLYLFYISNKPGVSGPVLRTALWSGNYCVLPESMKHGYAVQARKLKVWQNVTLQHMLGSEVMTI